jgi:hypothetical protein
LTRASTTGVAPALRWGLPAQTSGGCASGPNVLGVESLGELGICGAGAAIANAVFNATGVRVRDFPITLDKVVPGLPLDLVPRVVTRYFEADAGRDVDAVVALFTDDRRGDRQGPDVAWHRKDSRVGAGTRVTVPVHDGSV